MSIYLLSLPMPNRNCLGSYDSLLQQNEHIIIFFKTLRVLQTTNNFFMINMEENKVKLKRAVNDNNIKFE